MKRLITCTLLTLVLGFACKSRLTGNEGNLEFSYQADDRITDFNKPIAIGARLDIEVATVGDRKPVVLDAVETDPGSGLEVVGFNGNTLTVKAVVDGNGLLKVEATGAGAAVSDSVNLLARAAEKQELNHSCVTTRNGRYLTSNRVLIPFELTRNNNQPTIGYGYYPVTFSGSASLVIDESVKAQQFLHIDTGAAAGSATVSSDIDDTTLSVTLVEPGEIDGVELVLGTGQETDVGNVDPYYVLLTVNGDRVCQADTPKTVVSKTPGICSVQDRDPPNLSNGEAAHEFGWFAVTGIAAGECEVEVSYSMGNGGAGAAGTVKINIAP